MSHPCGSAQEAAGSRVELEDGSGSHTERGNVCARGSISCFCSGLNAPGEERCTPPAPPPPPRCPEAAHEHHESSSTQRASAWRPVSIHSRVPDLIPPVPATQKERQWAQRQASPAPIAQCTVWHEAHWFDVSRMCPEQGHPATLCGPGSRPPFLSRLRCVGTGGCEGACSTARRRAGRSPDAQGPASRAKWQTCILFKS